MRLLKDLRVITFKGILGKVWLGFVPILGT